MTDGFLDRLAARSAATRTVLCLGLDPDPEALPPGFPPSVAGIESFCRLLIDAAAPFAAAVKPNLAFFEAFGADGLAVLERILAALPADLLVVADAKRGDIGSTSTRYAAAIFDRLGADAVTVSPYLGSDAIRPLLERTDRFVYILCRTSNQGAGEFQDLVVERDADAPAEPLYLRVARRTVDWGPGGTAGLVVGATAPDELSRVRAVASGLAFLVPGVGAQGGDVEAVLRHGPAAAPPAGSGAGGGLLVNVSRGIATAAKAGVQGTGSADPGNRIEAAAREWAARLPVLL